ncbi:hypothetical protein DB346_05535 [Verrucomicrobia bacterium LW23]|nr:hypothetical protein DB346_05535 [Verrucomicrobia bacterium LW23]
MSAISALLGLNITDFKKGIALAKNEAQDLGNTIEKSMLNMAGIGGLADMVTNAFELTTELGNMALKLNATGQGLAQLRELARQNGMGFDEMGEGLEEFASKIADAVAGNTDLLDVFAKVGISQKDLANMKTDDVFKRLKASAIDTTDAMALFGESGIKLYPILQSLESAPMPKGIDQESIDSVMELQQGFAHLSDTISTGLADAFVTVKPYVATFFQGVKGFADQAVISITTLGIALYESIFGTSERAVKAMQEGHRMLEESQRKTAESMSRAWSGEKSPEAKEAAKNKEDDNKAQRAMAAEAAVAKKRQEIADKEAKAKEDLLTDEQKLEAIEKRRADAYAQYTQAREAAGGKDTAQTLSYYEKLKQAEWDADKLRTALAKKQKEEQEKKQADTLKEIERIEEKERDIAEKERQHELDKLSAAVALKVLQAEFNQLVAEENALRDKGGTAWVSAYEKRVELEAKLVEQTRKAQEEEQEHMEKLAKASEDVASKKKAIAEQGKMSYSVQDIANSGGQAGFEAKRLLKYEAEARNNVNTQFGARAAERAKALRQKLMDRGLIDDPKRAMKEALEKSEKELATIADNTAGMFAVKPGGGAGKASAGRGASAGLMG